MADPQTNPIILRYSTVAGSVPPKAEFTLNTFVVNLADGLLYWLDTANTVQSLPILPGDILPNVSVASAATTDIGAAPGRVCAITGNAVITSLGTKKNKIRSVVFMGACTLTHNATSLYLPTQANITAAVGDTATFVSNGSGNWTCIQYQKADGSALKQAAQLLSYRNRIINGNFAINQRGAGSASATYAAGAYILDRWKAGSAGVTLSFSSAANGDTTVSITAGSLLQIIEGPFYAPEGGAYIVSWSGTAQGRLYTGNPVAYTSGSGYTASPFALTGVTAGTQLVAEFYNGTIGLVQAEPGAVATAFERRDDELRRCFRYYEVASFSFIANGNGAGWYMGGYVFFKGRKRTAPSATLTNISHYATNNEGIDNNSIDGLRVYATTTDTTSNAQITGSYIVSSEL